MTITIQSTDSGGLIDVNSQELQIDGSLANPTLTGTATLNGKNVATVDQIPTITSGTEDLQAGVSELATGALYFVYE